MDIRIYMFLYMYMLNALIYTYNCQTDSFKSAHSRLKLSLGTLLPMFHLLFVYENILLKNNK